MSRKKTKESCETEAAKVGCRFISSLYSGNNKDLHKYECLTCFMEFFTKPNTITSGHGCPKCRYIKSGKAHSKTQAACNEEANRQNLEMLDHYSGRTREPHLYKCKICFYEFKARPNDVRKGHGCFNCFVKRQTLYSKICKRIACAIRGRYNLAIKAAMKNKKGSPIGDMGCTWDEFRVYFEKLFQPGMNWENWGRGAGKWNIDHIKPLASFDLEDEAEHKKAVHYTNLQPLWAIDNIIKGAKY